jgi:hypothetical protein
LSCIDPVDFHRDVALNAGAVRARTNNLAVEEHTLSPFNQTGYQASRKGGFNVRDGHFYNGFPKVTN